MFPIFSILGFDPTMLNADLTEILQRLNKIIDNSSTIKTTTETILSDMVGEVTFLASIAELNGAIASLAEDIDLAVAALGASIAAALTAQTAAIIANDNTNNTNVVNILNSLNNLLTSIQNTLGPIASNVSELVNKSDTIIARLNSIIDVLNVIDTRLTTMVTRLTSILTQLTTVVELVIQTNNHLIDTNMILDNTYSLLDLRLLQFQTHLDSYETLFQTMSARIQNIYDLMESQGTASLNALQNISDISFGQLQGIEALVFALVSIGQPSLYRLISDFHLTLQLSDPAAVRTVPL